MTDRGQVYTLEGIIAALIVMAGLLFALQATTATPQAGGITNPQAQQQDRTIARDVLAMADDETLREAVLYWDTGNTQFHCAPSGLQYYPAPGSANSGGAAGCPSSPPRSDWVPPTRFGQLLYQQFGSGYSYNVHVGYYEPDDSYETDRMIFQGQPGDGVVRATTSVALANDTRLYNAAGDRISTTASHPDFYASNDYDSDPTDEAPAVVFIELEVWRG